MSQTRTNRNGLLARVRRIAGQITAVDRALTDEAECSVVLHQVAGVCGAVIGLMDELIAEHLREHVAHLGLSDEARAEGTEELIAAIRRYAK